MKNTIFSRFPVDNASLHFLSQVRKDHTNTFRFTMTLTETICPETLQLAVDRVYRRFPTIIAGFYPGFFHFYQIPAKEPPQVLPDPGILLTMTAEELHTCAYRVYYQEKTIAIEAFHALTDGYGAIASFTTLVAEYLRLKYNISIPVAHTLINLNEPPTFQELSDAYLTYQEGKPFLQPNRYAYQLPGRAPHLRSVLISNKTISTDALLTASRRFGVSMTTLLSTVMAQSVMEIQNCHASPKRIKPVRVMVPVDLRRMFPSLTLRNFILYALPTMEPSDLTRPLSERLNKFRDQLKQQIERRRLASIMAYNVRAQESWFFRWIPLSIKRLILRIGNRFFGEVNSSVTVTNLGNVTLPQEMTAYVQRIDVTLTPRIRSPYNCAVIAYNGNLSINISRFCLEPELETVFFRNLDCALQETL